MLRLVIATVAGHGAAAEDFYRGKTVRLIVPSAPGGGYDAYGRTLAQYMQKHIPGEPTIVVQNMPGGGGLTGANWLFNVAPKDGTAFGLIQRGVPFHPFFGDKNATCQAPGGQLARQLHRGSRRGLGVSHLEGEDDRRRLHDGDRARRQRAERQRDLWPRVDRTTPSAPNIRIVSGYKANTETLLAIERGEVEGLSGSWSSLKANRPDWVKDNKVRALVQVAAERSRICRTSR